jgi:hypothetical protein
MDADRMLARLGPLLRTTMLYVQFAPQDVWRNEPEIGFVVLSAFTYSIVTANGIGPDVP